MVLSDHKPLMYIVHKDLVNAPLRLQRLLMRLQKYSIEIVYKSTWMLVAMELNASQRKLQLIRAKSDQDPQMLLLKESILQGWPKDIKQCPLPIYSYWNF